MSELGELLGSNTRGNIVEALALSNRPLTAYRIAKMYNMNVPKVYSEIRRLTRLGLLKTSRERGGREYLLADKDLRNIAFRLGSRVQTYDSWSSGKSRRERFRSGLARVPPFTLEGEPREYRPGERRMPGELENLAVLGRKKFDVKYRNSRGREYDRL